jgi:hypothetical protein
MRRGRFREWIETILVIVIIVVLVGEIVSIFEGMDLNPHHRPMILFRARE